MLNLTFPKVDVGELLARRTINEIFNQRMVNRLREIATGKADEAAEAAEAAAEISEPAVEVPAEGAGRSSVDTIVEQPAETAAETSADAPASEENTGETSQAAE